MLLLEGEEFLLYTIRCCISPQLMLKILVLSLYDELGIGPWLKE